MATVLCCCSACVAPTGVVAVFSPSNVIGAPEGGKDSGMVDTIPVSTVVVVVQGDESTFS